AGGARRSRRPRRGQARGATEGDRRRPPPRGGDGCRHASVVHHGNEGLPGQDGPGPDARAGVRPPVRDRQGGQGRPGGAGDQARRLKSLTGAEVILFGQVVAASRGEMPDLGPGWRSCAATISGRAVNTDNGDILSTAETTQSAAQVDDPTCGKEAIKKASRAFAQDMTKKIAARFVKDVSSGNDLHVTVRKVPSFRTATDFRAALSQRVRGVRNVSQRSFSAGTQELDVTMLGTAEEFAQEVERKKLGRFSVRVLGLTANTVDLELG